MQKHSQAVHSVFVRIIIQLSWLQSVSAKSNNTYIHNTLKSKFPHTWIVVYQIETGRSSCESLLQVWQFPFEWPDIFHYVQVCKITFTSVHTRGMHMTNTSHRDSQWWCNPSAMRASCVPISRVDLEGYTCDWPVLWLSHDGRFTFATNPHAEAHKLWRTHIPKLATQSVHRAVVKRVYRSPFPQRKGAFGGFKKHYT